MTQLIKQKCVVAVPAAGLRDHSPELTRTDDLRGREEALLENLSEEVRQCYEHAEECTNQAQATQDEKLRADYLLLAQSWLKLAGSYELSLRLKLFTNEAARRKKDLNQSIRQWQPISIAPFDRDLELAVRDGGDLHVLDFPSRRILSGWIKAATKERICVNPTHWRHWSDAGARCYP